MLTSKHFLQAGSIIALIGFAYSSTIGWLIERYVAADSYYSHGFLVPFVSAYFIWVRLKSDSSRSISIEAKAGGIHYRSDYCKWLGLGFIVFALVLHVFSILAEVYFISGYSLFLLMFGISLFLYGWNITKKILFPLVFLFFMFPLPLVAINAISFPMKTMATKVAVFVLKNFMRLPLINHGFEINFPHASLVVGNPCSGLRSLITLLALSSIFAHLMKTKMKSRCALVTLSIPIAIVSNIFRIVLLSLAVFVYGSKAAQGFFHDFSGYIVFLMEFLLIWYFWRSLDKPLLRERN